MRKKPKRKAKGKKLYKNTHGTWHRVRRNYRIRRKIKHRKMMVHTQRLLSEKHSS